MTIPLPSPNRRQFLGTAVSTAALPALHAVGAEPPPRRFDPKDELPFQLTQVMPEPKIALPTDSTTKTSDVKRIAAITTTYFKYSHADDIITRFIEGYAVLGRIHQPHCKVVSLYIDQLPETDIGKGMAARYKIPLVKSIPEALTLGEEGLAVDGVLLIGEHGDYPKSKNGQVMYPRRKFFEEICEVFKKTGKSVPVYNDKHFSYNWDNTIWMYNAAKQLKFSLMAGSSVPVAWRRPPVDLRFGVKMEDVLAAGAGEFESSGFHILECLQAFAEKRAGGETGVKGVQFVQGKGVWRAGAERYWSLPLLGSIIGVQPETKGKLDEVDAEPAVFLIEYNDGLRGACYFSPAHFKEYAMAARVSDFEKPIATACYLPKPQRDHFSFLCNHIEKMFLTDLPSYPVERTLLTSGMLTALMDSRAQGKYIETPHLKISYRPPA